MTDIVPIKQHSEISPSNLHRVLECPASVALSHGIPRGTSEAAEHGTDVHAVAELLLRAWLNGKWDGNPEYVKPELIPDEKVFKDCEDEAMRYVTRLIRDFMTVKKESDLAYLMPEVKVDLSELLPGMFGTADAVIVDPGRKTLIIRDLKTGRGLVQAETADGKINPQLAAYAFGVYTTISEFVAINKVIVQIDQINLYEFLTAELSSEELEDWAIKTKPQLEDALSDAPQKIMKAGEHCAFCAYAPKCQKLAEYVGMVKMDEITALTDQQISEILEKASVIQTYVNNLKTYVKERLLKGEVIHGCPYKVVSGRSTRSWSDPEAVAEILKDKGYTDDVIFTEPAVKSPSQMEKALHGKKKMEATGINDYIVAVSGEPMLVPVTDKRPALYEQDATNDFEGI